MRVIRTARSLGIETVVVHSDADADAPFALAADRTVRLPGVSSTQTYLDGDKVIAAALASGADAVHPGYGFLSENAAFARAVQAAGLIWIGPTPESIEAMALKVEAKRIARAADVPLVAGAELPDGMPEADVLVAADRVGFPLMIKASAGGGGKGMRIVAAREDLIAALASASREAKSSFGDDTLFIERYLAGARHVEVQVFGDVHGNVVHLYERECSIQRRHQKVIEEAPSPGVTPAVRDRLHAAAVSLARTIGYVGAGTVEFMVFGQGAEQEFSFLEMNTRLQVEHPVTERITGLDLVAWQIVVAEGAELPLGQDGIRATGHAIEARLYAEDPANDYRPATGTIHRFSAGDGTQPSLRVDTGVADGSVITPHYDPMLAKVISHASTREEAASMLSDGLRRMTLHGPITNRDSLVAILRSSAFLAGDTTTSFLDEHPRVLDPIVCAEDEQRHAIAAARVVEAMDAPDPLVPLGWRNVPGVPQFVILQRRGATGCTTVLFDGASGAGGVRIVRTDSVPYREAFALAGDELDVEAHVSHSTGAREALATVSVAGVAARCSVSRYGDEVFVDDGLHSSVWTVLPRFADHSADGAGHGAVTPVPGTIVAVEVEAGDVVTVGQVLVVLEAMKMEHRILADLDGVIARVLVETGQSVDAHTVVIEYADVIEDVVNAAPEGSS